MAERVARTLQQLPWLVGVAGGQALGYAYTARFRERAAYQWSAEATVYVSSGHHRAGIGRALYGRLFDVLARQGYFTAYAGITLPNPASVALHRAFGFESVGTYRRAGYKFGRWWDVSWWQRSIPEPANPMSGPPPFNQSSFATGKTYF